MMAGAPDGKNKVEEETGSSNSEIIINMTRALIGMGTLTLPKAFARVGIIPAFIISAVVPLFAFSSLSWAVALKDFHLGRRRPNRISTEVDNLWTVEAAIEASNGDQAFSHLSEVGDSCFGGFDIVVQHVLGFPGRAFFVTVVLITQFSSGVSYISAVEEGVQALCPGFSQELGLLGIGSCLMALTLIAPNLRDIAWLSLLSTVVLIYIFVSMPIEGFRNQQAKAEPVSLWHPTAGFLDYGFTFGAVGFCYCEIALGLCMYEDMKHKEDFGFVMGSAFSLSTIVSCIFGALGYWAFGGAVQELAYLNFPVGSMTSYVCIVSYNLILMASYLLMMVPVFLYVRDVCPATPYPVIRCGAIALTVCLSKIIPSVMDAILLLTSITCMVSDLIIPSICFICMGSRYYFLSRCLALVSIAVGVAGAASAFLSGLLAPSS